MTSNKPIMFLNPFTPLEADVVRELLLSQLAGKRVGLAAALLRKPARANQGRERPIRMAAACLGTARFGAIRLGAVLLALAAAAVPCSAAQPQRTDQSGQPMMFLPNPEPDSVRSAAIGLRAACSTWPTRPAPALKMSEARSPPVGGDGDRDVCELATDPVGFTRVFAIIHASLTVVGLILAACVIGLLRMILVFAWSWRPRRLRMGGGHDPA